MNAVLRLFCWMAILGGSPAQAQQLYCWASATSFCPATEREIAVPCTCHTSVGALVTGRTITSWRLAKLVPPVATQSPGVGGPVQRHHYNYNYRLPPSASNLSTVQQGSVRTGAEAQAPSPPASPEAGMVDTVYAPIFEPGQETPGYGLYSYLIMTANDPRASAFLSAILQTTPGAATSPWNKHEELNLLLVPMQAASKNQCNAVTAGSLKDCGEGGLAAALNAYDYDGARTFIYRMCQKSPPNLPAVCAAGARIGPYLFTYRQPASAVADFVPPFLFVDLSSVDPAAFGEYYAAYKAQVQSKDPTGNSEINSLRLKILNIVLTGRGLVIPIDTAVAEILHPTPPK